MCFDVLNVIIFVFYTQQHIGMTSIKFVASQAQSINQYKNLRNKVLKCCANIF